LAGDAVVLASHISAIHEGFVHQSSASTPDGAGFQLQLSSEKNKIGWKMAVQDSNTIKKKTLLEVKKKQNNSFTQLMSPEKLMKEFIFFLSREGSFGFIMRTTPLMVPCL